MYCQRSPMGTACENDEADSDCHVTETETPGKRQWRQQDSLYRR